jgi:hypothetical protein
MPSVEVLHREVHALELAARRLEVALDPRAGAEDKGVVLRAELLDRDVGTDFHPAAELDALRLQDLEPAVHDPLLELRVGDAETQEPTGRLVALVHDDPVADLVELRRGREARRPGADDGDRLAGAFLGRLGHDPALLEGAVDDRVLDLLDHHRVVDEVEDARRLAWRGADEARELGEVVRRVELLDGRLPLPGADQVVPVGNQVPQRAAVVAERDPAVHAPSRLLAQIRHQSTAREVAAALAITPPPSPSRRRPRHHAAALAITPPPRPSAPRPPRRSPRPRGRLAPALRGPS